MTGTRERLPNRRRADTVGLDHGGERYHLTIGVYDDDRPGEVFLHGAKVGSDSDGLHGDIAVLISRLLQLGDDPAAMAKGMGRIEGSAPASVVGAIADILAAEAETALEAAPTE